MTAESFGCCARHPEALPFTCQNDRLLHRGRQVRAPFNLDVTFCKWREFSSRHRCMDVELTLGRQFQAARSELVTVRSDADELTKKEHLVPTWRRLCDDGQLSEAVDALDLLVHAGAHVDTARFYSVLRRCMGQKNLTIGKRVHALVARSGHQSNLFLANHIICMYASHKKLKEAMQVFSQLRAPDRHVWASIILAHARHGQPTRALELYRQMQESNVQRDSYVFVAALKACAAAADLQSGKEVHADIVRSCVDPDVFVGNCLVDMYAKCGSLADARRCFDLLPEKDIVSTTAMIAGYAQHGLGEEALALYATMQQDSLVQANRVTYVCLLKACASAGALNEGKEIHSHILQRGLDTDGFIGNCLVDMYAKCGSLVDAREVFDRLLKRDEVAWNAMIGGYSQHGLGHEAIALYHSMQQAGICPTDHVTYVHLLKACASTGALLEGKNIHSRIMERNMETKLVVGNSLVLMYTKCGSLVDARKVFDRLLSRDVVTWNTMIGGYAQHGLSEDVLALHVSMKQEGLISSDYVTFVCLIKACASAGAVLEGREVHRQILEQGLEANVVIGNCLVDMYSKFGCLHEAREVFDRLPSKDVVAWTAMVAGYAQQGMGHEALNLYARMQEQGVRLNNHSFACLLKACSNVGALCQGQRLHAEIQAKGLQVNAIVGTSLVNMYAKCGRLQDACKVFYELPRKDVVTWNALINGYAEHGEAEKAMRCFDEMQQQGVKPNEATFSCLLVACSHAGLVSKGQEYFDSIAQQHGIVPTLQHYNCMVDLLGRSGCLAEAEKLLQTMPYKNNVVGWTTLLSACKSHGDMERGSRCFDHVVKLEPENASAYVLLTSMYANASRWQDVSRIENLRKSSGAWKKPAKACIEVQSSIQEFTVGEQIADLKSKSRRKNLILREDGGHFSHTQLVPKAVPESVKDEALCGHAEKLALAYGLLNTPDGSSLLVTKNLRMCSDCHSSTKILSRLERREIVVRDPHRVHHFVNGFCSCDDRH